VHNLLLLLLPMVLLHLVVLVGLVVAWAIHVAASDLQLQVLQQPLLSLLTCVHTVASERPFNVAGVPSVVLPE
jgi:hypothetical protein